MAFVSKTIDFILHLGASEKTFQRALELRKTMTEAEKNLWNELKGRKLGGLKFRRQHPLHWYVADFYCHEKRMVVEVDGGIHNFEEIKEHDLNRSSELDRLGITIIRFTNEEIKNSLNLVLKKIKEVADEIK